MSAASDDIAGLLVQKGIATLRVSQGEVRSWDPFTLANRVDWRGITLDDVPVLAGVSALGYQAGDSVILLGADVAGKRGMTQWWILGRLAVPGDDSPDVVIRGSDVIVAGGRVVVRDGGSINVEDGGDIVVTGGDMVVLDQSGNVRAGMGRGEAGAGVFQTNHANGAIHALFGDISVGGVKVGQGFLLQQDNGQDILSAFPSSETGNIEVRAFDHDGNQTFTTDKNGAGLDRPYLDVPMYHQNSTGDIRYGGTSFINIWMGRLRHTHPALHAQCRAWVSTDDATVPEGEIRLMVAGQQVGSTQTVTSETSSFFDFGASVHDITGLGMTYNEFQPVEIEGRISANAGTGRLLSVLAYGVTKRGSI